MKKSIIPSILLLLAVSCNNGSRMVVKEYPKTDKDTTVTDDYFGNIVSDPYRHLEDDNSLNTAKWISSQNSLTNTFLKTIPFRKDVKKRMTELYDYPKYGVPRRYGDNYIFFKNDGLQNQSVCYIRKVGSNDTEVLLDPNTMSKDGIVALNSVSVSPDNKFMAYSTSKAGSDWSQIMVMNIETKECLSDTIIWVKFSDAQWGKDGFYYSMYDRPYPGSEFSAANEHQKVYFHKIGTPQSSDVLIFYDEAHPLRYFNSFVDSDSEYIFITASEGTSGSEVYFKKQDTNQSFSLLYKGFDSDYSIIKCTGNKVITLTNNDAANFKLIETDISSEVFSQRDLIKEDSSLLLNVSIAGDRIFASYLKDVSSLIKVFDMEGNFLSQVELPTIGTASGFEGESDATNVFYSFSSFNYPPTIFRYDIATGKSVESDFYEKSGMKFNPDDFVVEQHFYTSKDSTKIPMFICHKKGLIKNGQNLTHLYAYGGFNISLTPSFSPVNIMFMEQGGVYVLANIRGGGEYGEKWHKGGMLENKQNVFDDFIAATEYMISNNYTCSNKIAISGGSNGGLLIGACITQRPDLFSVAFPRVGVLDMLRYHKFTIGWGWVVEYGSSDNESQFGYLLKYSPLHNIKKGECYPSTMIMTADHDDRVVPAHSFKFAAALQEAQSCDNPILIRIESKAGHGAGKPTSKIIDEITDMYSFMFYQTDTPYVKQFLK